MARLLIYFLVRSGIIRPTVHLQLQSGTSVIIGFMQLWLSSNLTSFTPAFLFNHGMTITSQSPAPFGI